MQAAEWVLYSSKFNGLTEMQVTEWLLYSSNINRLIKWITHAMIISLLCYLCFQTLIFLLLPSPLSPFIWCFYEKLSTVCSSVVITLKIWKFEKSYKIFSFSGGGGDVFRNKLFFTRKSCNIVGRAELWIKEAESASWGLAQQTEDIWFGSRRKSTRPGMHHTPLVMNFIFAVIKLFSKSNLSTI